MVIAIHACTYIDKCIFSVIRCTVTKQHAALPMLFHITESEKQPYPSKAILRVKLLSFNEVDVLATESRNHLIPYSSRNMMTNCLVM